MAKITVSYQRESRIPEWATPQVLKAMQKEGKSLRQIAKLVGVCQETVRQLILKAK